MRIEPLFERNEPERRRSIKPEDSGEGESHEIWTIVEAQAKHAIHGVPKGKVIGRQGKNAAKGPGVIALFSDFNIHDVWSPPAGSRRTVETCQSGSISNSQRGGVIVTLKLTKRIDAKVAKFFQLLQHFLYISYGKEEIISNHFCCEHIGLYQQFEYMCMTARCWNVVEDSFLWGFVATDQH